MIDREDAARRATVAKLHHSREELRALLDPPRQDPASAEGGHSPGAADGFPRSRTMQMLMSSRGLGAVGALAGGLLIARPALALRVLRMLPTTAVARMLAVKAFTAMRSKRQP